MRTASELVFFGFLGFIKGGTRCDRAFDDAFGEDVPRRRWVPLPCRREMPCVEQVHDLIQLRFAAVPKICGGQLVQANGDALSQREVFEVRRTIVIELDVAQPVEATDAVSVTK